MPRCLAGMTRRRRLLRRSRGCSGLPPGSCSSSNCGEGACSRWSAKRSQFSQRGALDIPRLPVYDCFAAERDGAAIRQAPSPQVSVSTSWISDFRS
ncbi:hypothetical protein EMIT0194MI4_180019 [Pseudomonas sp. IT-194MI4]